jgi:PPP family 3-phenylpropionic acid transporter
MSLSAAVSRVREWFRNPFFQFSFFYVFLFAAGAFVLPFYVVYLQSLGWSGTEIGALTLVQRLISFVSSPLLGQIADRTKRHRLVVFVTSIATPLITGLVPAVASSHVGVWIAILLSTFVRSGAVPVCDRSIVRWYKLRGGQSARYGRVRLWGAVGWGLGSLLVGWIVDAIGGELNVLFIAHAICFVAFVLPALSLVDFPPLDSAVMANDINGTTAADAKAEPTDNVVPLEEVTKEPDPEPEATAIEAPAAPDAAPAKGKLWSAETVIFFMIVLTQGVFMGIIATALFLYLTELGASTTLLGGTLLSTCVSEVPFFFFSDKIVKALTPHGVLVLASWCLALRLLLYSAIPLYPALELILPVELLHGVTYACMWSAAVAYGAYVAPPHLEATVQGVMGGIYFGAGSGIGGAVGGWAYGAYGGQATFRVAALVNIGVALLSTCILLSGRVWRWLRRRMTTNNNNNNNDGNAVAYSTLQSTTTNE